jgi:hypothetical protein
VPTKMSGPASGPCRIVAVRVRSGMNVSLF